MGLDMYLEGKFSKRAFAEPTDWTSDEPRERSKDFETVRRAVKMPTSIPVDHQSSFYTVAFPLAKWRKANQIHNWFVQNCNDGRDESCDKVYVNIDHLIELLEVVNQILDTPEENRQSVAEELLPPTSGFFFGTEEISEDSGYYDDLRYTKERLDEIIKFQKQEEEKHRGQCFDSFEYEGNW